MFVVGGSIPVTSHFIGYPKCAKARKSLILWAFYFRTFVNFTQFTPNPGEWSGEFRKRKNLLTGNLVINFESTSSLIELAKNSPAANLIL